MADRAGAMDERITLRKFSRVPDGAGGVVQSWADFEDAPEVWAAVSFKGGREGLSEGRITAEQMTTFEIHNRPDVSELDGIIWRGEFYNIRVIRRYGPRKLRMWIDAERGVADGN